MPSRHAADLLAVHAGRAGLPTTVTFQVTDRCNYDCVHCYQEHTERSELSTDEVFAVLEELAEFGVLFLTLMGGEFFMRPDADAILDKAHALGFAIKLKTTGHHITDKRADRMAKLRPLQVDLSVYAADKHVHDQVTGQQGSFERTYAAAVRLRERGIPFQLNTAVMETNASQAPALLALGAELGGRVSFDPRITAMENRDQQPVELRMSGETVRSFYTNPDTANVQELAKGYVDPTPGRERRPIEATPCRAGQDAVAITPQGEVWPCIALPLAVGNVRDGSFADIWKTSPELDEVRGLTWAHISECNRCELRNFCDRCHGMAMVEQGELGGPSLEACRHAVAIRDSLREQGQLPEDHTAMPPTWDRVDKDGQHHRLAAGGVRPSALKVLP